MRSSPYKWSDAPGEWQKFNPQQTASSLDLNTVHVSPLALANIRYRFNPWTWFNFCIISVMIYLTLKIFTKNILIRRNNSIEQMIYLCRCIITVPWASYVQKMLQFFFSYFHSYLRKFMPCALNCIKGLHVLVNNTDIHVYGLHFFFFIKIWIFKMKRSIDYTDNHSICYSQPWWVKVNFNIYM